MLHAMGSEGYQTSPSTPYPSALLHLTVPSHMLPSCSDISHHRLKSFSTVATPLLSCRHNNSNILLHLLPKRLDGASWRRRKTWPALHPSVTTSETSRLVSSVADFDWANSDHVVVPRRAGTRGRVAPGDGWWLTGLRYFLQHVNVN